MDNVEWSRMMADIFFAHQDPQGELQKFRHQIPPFVLRTFCDNTASGQQMWIYDQNQIPTCVVNTVVPNSDSETLIIYRPATREFERRRWTESFGAEQIYSRFFDNLTTQRYMREAFDKFELIQQVDRDIFQGLVDPIWQIQSLQPQGTITLRRDDVWTLRKFLHLMTNLHGRDRTMHLLAHAPEMEDARIRRKRFIESRGMEHPRDVWLYNAEQTLKTPHHEVHQNTGIFDLDREDYRANARERFLVFWEAGPGDEFILTENGFGGFEGGQIGARQDSIINMGSRELEQHMYTRDFMWHQLYVLSPTLVAALCHGTLMHPDLTRAQRKRWGLRRSLLENLPHEVAPKYYKDMTKGDASFIKPGFPVPQDVEWAFGINVSLEKRKADEIEFPVQRLSPKQVSMVNSVLLHNQHNGPIVKSVCLRSPPQYQSLYNSLVMFQQQPWEKYSDEEQNDYTALTERLRVFLQPTVPEPLSAHLQYAQQQQQQQAQQFHQLPPHQLHQMPSMPMPIPPMQPPMSDPRRIYAGDRSMTMPEVPRYEQPIHESRPMDLRANSQMSHSSHSSSFTPSSQSSQTYSSASSQTSSSSATSIEPHRFETKPVPAAAAREPKSRPQSPSRKNEKPRKGNSQTENVPTKPAKPAQAPKVANIVIEHTVQEIQERHRGRQASRSDPPPPPPQIKVSPIPDRVELTASKPKPRHQPEQTKPQEPQQKPQTQTQQKPQTQPQQKPQTQTQTQQTQPPPPQQQQHQPQQQHQKQQHQKQQHQKQQPMQQQQQQQKPQSQPMQQQQSQPQPMQQRFQPQSVLQQNPLPQPVQQKASVLPERPMYVMDVMDPMRPIQTEHERNEPVPQWNFSGVELQGPQYDMGLPESRAHSQQSQRSTSQTNEHSSQSSEHVRQRQYETERQYEVLMQDLQSHPQPCDRNSQTSETARRQQYDSPRPELGQIQRPIPPTDRHSADTVSSRGRPYEPPRPEQGQIQRPLQRPSPVGDGRKVEQSQPMRNTASHERSYHYESKPEQQQSQPMRNTGSHDRSHQYEPKPEQQSQPMRNTMSHDRSSYSSEHARQRQYEFELLKPEQPKPPPVPAHKTQPQILKPQPQRPVNHNISTEAPAGAVDESRGRPYEVITPEGLQPQKQQQQQRSPNSSGERQMRPGVEIVRPHTLEPVRPEPRSNLQPSQAQQKPQYIDNAKVKQLRFDARTLSHKLSDMSLDGSMIVQTGDDNETDMSGSESESEDDEDGQTIGGEEEDDAWEDEGFAESEELSNTKPKSTKPHVRFADRPLSRTGMRGVPIHIERPLSRLGFAAHLGRKVDFIERPSSRLGRRVEIVRPLSRNGQRANMGLAGKGRQTHGHGGVHAHR